MKNQLAILADTVVSKGINLKEVVLLVFVLVVIGVIGWFVAIKPIPDPIKWLIYLVLGIVGVVIVYRFIQQL